MTPLRRRPGTPPWPFLSSPPPSRRPAATSSAAPAPMVRSPPRGVSAPRAPARPGSRPGHVGIPATTTWAISLAARVAGASSHRRSSWTWVRGSLTAPRERRAVPGWAMARFRSPRGASGPVRGRAPRPQVGSRRRLQRRRPRGGASPSQILEGRRRKEVALLSGVAQYVNHIVVIGPRLFSPVHMGHLVVENPSASVGLVPHADRLAILRTPVWGVNQHAPGPGDLVLVAEAPGHAAHREEEGGRGARPPSRRSRGQSQN